MYKRQTLYRAGETAPWGTAIGTQLLLRNPLVQSGGGIGSGNGGAINLEATHANISVGNIRSLSETADGGRIDLNANKDVITGLINSSSVQGNGGAIDLDAGGDITTQYLYSGSNSSSGNSGNGGDITLNAKTIKFNPPEYGNAEKLKINTFSVGQKESEEGKGGDVNITTNNLSNTEILTLSSHSESGKVTIESKTQEPLQIKDSSIITREKLKVTVRSAKIKEIQVETGDTQSGDVSINSSCLLYTSPSPRD